MTNTRNKPFRGRIVIRLVTDIRAGQTLLRPLALKRVWLLMSVKTQRQVVLLNYAAFYTFKQL